MLELPQSTVVNRKIPKELFYEKLHANSNLKELFTKQIKSIVWRYKLSRETIHLEPKDGIEEVQVFEIQLKEQAYSTDILRAIDKAIPYPILYILLFENMYELSIAYKERNQIDNNRAVIHSYHSSDWQKTSELQLNIIQGLDLMAIYENIIRSLLPNQTNPEVELSIALEQQSRLEKLVQECKKLESKVKLEKQFNRKVELNMRLQQKRKELALLIGS